jgi:hypothetical protein
MQKKKNNDKLGNLCLNLLCFIKIIIPENEKNHKTRIHCFIGEGFVLPYFFIMEVISFSLLSQKIYG